MSYVIVGKRCLHALCCSCGFWCLISPYCITYESNISVMRIKKMIIKLVSTCQTSLSNAWWTVWRMMKHTSLLLWLQRPWAFFAPQFIFTTPCSVVHSLNKSPSLFVLNSLSPLLIVTLPYSSGFRKLVLFSFLSFLMDWTFWMLMFRLSKGQ